MNNMKRKFPVSSFQFPVESGRNAARFRRSSAFTLIELLAVITIIGVLAAFLVPTIGAVKRHELISKTQAELAQVETAIDRYKSAYGIYPPDNANSGPLTNQLYFELLGTTNINNSKFQTLDGSAQMNVGDVTSLFGAGGFVNCSKPNADESTPQARNFLPDLRPNQIVTLTTNPIPDVVKILVGSVGGPDASYQPLGQRDMNPWRYNSHNPTNNPGSYDLWIQLQIAGKKYLISNWSRQPQVNSPLP
jgi:prepilin-type N-terminal cleavage/methylation domain-containing protein